MVTVVFKKEVIMYAVKLKELTKLVNLSYTKRQKNLIWLVSHFYMTH